MQVMDNSVKPLPVQRIDAEKVVGAAIDDRMVFFSRDSRQLTGTFTFEIPKAAGKKVKVLLTDLAEGKWTVSKGKKTITSAKVNDQSGTLYFEAAPGKYVVSK